MGWAQPRHLERLLAAGAKRCATLQGYSRSGPGAKRSLSPDAFSSPGQAVVAREVVVPEFLSIHAIEDRVFHLPGGADWCLHPPHFVSGLEHVVKTSKGY